MEELTYNQRYYRSNRERELARSKKYADENPEWRKANNRRRYLPERKEKTAEATKKWGHANWQRYAEIKNRASIRFRLKQHGLTMEQFEEMLAAQNYRCAICRTDKVGQKRNGKGAKSRGKGWPSTAQQGDFTWHVDHCHKTGKVRGLLCHHCNAGLGHFKDDPALLKTAIAYLCS